MCDSSVMVIEVLYGVSDTGLVLCGVVFGAVRWGPEDHARRGG